MAGPEWGAGGERKGRRLAKAAGRLGAAAVIGAASGFLFGRAPVKNLEQELARYQNSEKPEWVVPAGRFSLKLPQKYYEVLSWHSEYHNLHPNRVAQFLAEWEAIPDSLRNSYKAAILKKSDSVLDVRQRASLREVQEALERKRLFDVYRDIQRAAEVKWSNTDRLLQMVREQVARQKKGVRD